jgi:transcriptional regulator with XRE-family HTH domain
MFSERLISRRQRLNLSQEGLAELTGIGVSSISAWERGLNMPTGRMLEKLSEHLKISKAWLMGEDSAPAVQFLNDASIQETASPVAPVEEVGLFPLLTDVTLRAVIADLSRPAEDDSVSFPLLEKAVGELRRRRTVPLVREKSGLAVSSAVQAALESGAELSMDEVRNPPEESSPSREAGAPSGRRRAQGKGTGKH